MQVFPITNGAGTATPTLGSVITVGSYIQAIGADFSGDVWVAGSTISDDTVTNNVYVISNVNSVSTVRNVTGLTYAAGAGTFSGTHCRFDSL